MTPQKEAPKFKCLPLQVAVMKVNGTEVDGLSQEVLRELDDSDDGVLNTVELRDRLKMNGGDIEDGKRQNLNRKVKYRFEKLEAAGLADVRAGGRADNGETLPKEAEITQSGVELVDRYDLHDGVGEEEGPLEEHVRRLDRRSGQLEDELESEIGRLEDDVEKLFRVLGVLFREQGIDVEGVSRVGVDPHRLRPAGERGDGE